MNEDMITIFQTREDSTSHMSLSSSLGDVHSFPSLVKSLFYILQLTDQTEHTIC